LFREARSNQVGCSGEVGRVAAVSTVDDDGREPTEAIAESLKDAFEGDGIDDLDPDPVAVMLGEIRSPRAYLAVLLCEVGRKRSRALLGVYLLADAAFAEDNLAMHAVEKFGWRVCQDFDSNRPHHALRPRQMALKPSLI